MTKVTDIASLVRRWRLQPELFVLEALNVKEITAQQKQGLEELRRIVFCKLKRADGMDLTREEAEYADKIGISIMSGRGTGKDAYCAWVILWFLTCFFMPKIGVTAPTKHQLKDILWSEISKWLRGSELKDLIVWQSDKIYWKESGGKEWYAVARTTNVKGSMEEQAETLSGLHEDYMALIVDEGSGVPDAVYKPLESTMTGKCNFAIIIFNPTQSTGYAIDTHMKHRAYWVPLQWNAEESELVSKSSIEFKERKYGRDSNYYRINVLGLPPLASEDILIPWDWVMACVDLDMEPIDGDSFVWGFDVGAGGDPSIICKMRGPKVLPMEEKNTHESEILTGWAVRQILDEGPDAVMVDTIGVGWGIAGNLRDRTEVRIIDVKVSEAASDDERFAGLRDELCWAIRTCFQNRSISIPNDETLIAEATTLKYKELPNGKIKVESKNDLRARKVMMADGEKMMSPNRFDALCLTQYFSSESRRKLMKSIRANKKRQTASSWKTT